MKHNYKTFIFLIAMLPLALQSYGQGYNKTISSRATNIPEESDYFLVTPKIIKTNSVVKMGESNVPFDQPFLLEITRPKKAIFVSAKYKVKDGSAQMEIAKFYEASDTSKLVYLLITNLKSDKAYEIAIDWNHRGYFGQTMPPISVYLCHFESAVIWVKNITSAFLFLMILQRGLSCEKS